MPIASSCTTKRPKGVYRTGIGLIDTIAGSGSLTHPLHHADGTNHVQPMHPVLTIILLYGTMFLMLNPAQTGSFIRMEEQAYK